MKRGIYALGERDTLAQHVPRDQWELVSRPPPKIFEESGGGCGGGSKTRYRQAARRILATGGPDQAGPAFVSAAPIPASHHSNTILTRTPRDGGVHGALTQRAPASSVGIA